MVIGDLIYKYHLLSKFVWDFQLPLGTKNTQIIGLKKHLALQYISKNIIIILCIIIDPG
jgi:hypothetical protein